MLENIYLSNTLAPEMQFQENNIKDILSQAYGAAYANATGKEPDAFVAQQFEAWYNLNRKSIQVKFQANIKGSDIFVHPVSENIINAGTPAGVGKYMFETYRGWEGKIIANAKNGNYPAYLVSISGDGVSFIKTTINVADVQPLENKKYFDYGK